MTVPAWVEVQLAVGGALKLARGDPSGLGFFDTSIDGFWRSFRAALICYPFFLVLLSFRVAAPYWAASGVPRILAVETIGYAISWIAFPLLVLPLARWLGREDRFQEATGPAVGVGDEDPLVAVATCLVDAGANRAGNSTGAIVQVRREAGDVDPGERCGDFDQLARERPAADDQGTRDICPWVRSDIRSRAAPLDATQRHGARRSGGGRSRQRPRRRDSRRRRRRPIRTPR